MAAASSRVYNINVTVQLKRGKDEVEFAIKETEKLHNLLSTGPEERLKNWVMDRIEKIQEMVLFPDAAQIRSEIQSALKKSESVSEE